MVAIIDYDAGNIKSVEKAFRYLGQDVILTRDPGVIVSADRVVLPGVGAFGDAMERLQQYGLVDVIHEVADRQIPFLGICLGMQLLFDSSEEAPGVKGLGILPGKIVRFSDDMGLKIPHMGWNSLTLTKDSRILRGIGQNPYVYFVHSYYLQSDRPEDVSATTQYGCLVHAAVEADNVFGCQFHPEKSSRTGLTILKNFAAL